MQMISFVFLALVFLTFAILYICGRFIKNAEKARNLTNIILLFSSYVFVLYADFRFAVILLMLTVSTWFFAKFKRFNWAGIVIALLTLGVFKYLNFFISSFGQLFGTDSVTVKIILPIGISFYSFSAISYLIDVKRGKVEKQSLLDVALYLSYFPKITSGPIQKSKDFFEQISSKRNVGWQTFEKGIQIFVFGLFKKLVFADRLAVFVNQVYATPAVFGSLTVFMASVAYSLQIYLDFSGYSDMAIGISEIMGIHLPRNFNLPYLSHNVTELWKRWHITLSSWLQDYLYISFGGNRKGTIRTYVNLILTMLIGGIWHGANWTFILWGLLHGVALAIHKLWMKVTDSQQKKHSVVANVISILVTFLFTTFCWIFFRADSVSDAWNIIIRILAFDQGVEQPYFWLLVSFAVLLVSSIAAAVHSKPGRNKLKKHNTSYVDGFYPILDLSKLWQLTLFFVICGLLLCLAYTGGSPFIYGNF